MNRIILPGNFYFIFLGDTLARQLTQYDLTGITPEELQKKTVADITKQNLDIIFIGINPGYHSALTGHHYSGSGKFFTIQCSRVFRDSGHNIFTAPCGIRSK